MKQILFGIAVVSVLAMTGCASTNADHSAVDKVARIDGKNIAITDISRIVGSNNVVLKKEDFTKVYIKTPVFLDKIHKADNQSPGATVMLNERFAMYGIKVVGSLEEADALLMFNMQGDISTGSAANAAKNSNSPTLEQVVANTGAVASGFIANGPSALVGGLIGLAFERDKYLLLTGRLVKQPKLVKGFVFENYETSVKDGSTENGIIIHYKLEKGNEATDDVVFKMAIDQWIKKYIAFDVKPTTPIAAATPAVVAVGEEAKK